MPLEGNRVPRELRKPRSMDDLDLRVRPQAVEYQQGAVLQKLMLGSYRTFCF